MTLAQLRVLVTVVQHGSVRAAAESLRVTQSAVSASLAALQRSIGLQLVARHGGGLRLTEAGRIYVDYAERALGLLDAGQAAATGELAPARGRVRLASVTTAGEQLVPPILASFRTRYPLAEVALEVGNRETVWDWHLVARAKERLPATSLLLVEHATDSGEFRRVGPMPPSSSPRGNAA